jgi:hypothetical protein
MGLIGPFLFDPCLDVRQIRASPNPLFLPHEKSIVAEAKQRVRL